MTCDFWVMVLHHNATQTLQCERRLSLLDWYHLNVTRRGTAANQEHKQQSNTSVRHLLLRQQRAKRAARRPRAPSLEAHAHPYNVFPARPNNTFCRRRLPLLLPKLLPPPLLTPLLPPLPPPLLLPPASLLLLMRAWPPIVNWRFGIACGLQ